MEPWIEALWEPLEHILQTYPNSDSTCETTADTAADIPEGTVSVANQEANSSSTGCHLTPSNSLSITGAVDGSEGKNCTVDTAEDQVRRETDSGSSTAGVGDLLTQGIGSQAAATTAADAQTAEDSTSPLTFERALKKCCEALESVSLALPTVPPGFTSVKYDEVST